MGNAEAVKNQCKIPNTVFQIAAKINDSPGIHKLRHGFVVNVTTAIPLAILLGFYKYLKTNGLSAILWFILNLF